MKRDFDVAIIGAGVAGMTAAIYLKRAGLSCVLIEKEIYGGQINLSPSVNNYPGFIEIDGSSLSMAIFEQVKNLGVCYLNKEVKSVNFSKNIKEIFLNDEVIYASKVIIATGRIPKKLDLDGIEKLEGRGVSYCATCDANFFKDANVLVVGGGNSALEEAIYLSNICKTVTIINRGSGLRAESYYIDKIKDISNIEVLYDAEVKKLEMGDRFLSSALVRVGNDEKTLEVSGCFTYIGYVPNTFIFDKLIDLDDDGYVVVDQNNETSVEGVFAVGDIVRKAKFQLITAMNDSVVAVNKCIREFE